MIGQSLAQYRITAKLGEGGMGEVYQATDERLNREVAVKVLPEAVAEDPDRLARFKREAQLLAALNHPNIAQVYGLEETATTRAIVLELIEGDTLADRIARGPVPVEEALALAAQITEALEAAHDKGIIHRDLKPANVKVTPQGAVKVLDFGLAKALEPDRPQQDLANSPTMTAAATQMGIIMGTASYMAPEQARGKLVDRRVDIWAFGCVLYELLTGVQPFPGSDVSEIMAHVITREPDLDLLPRDLPTGIRDLLTRCLRKDPRMRLPDIGAARIAIAEAGDAPEPTAADPGSAGARRRSPWPLVLTAIAALVLGLAVGKLALNAPAAPTPAATHFDLVLDPPADHWAMTLTDDGGTLVYSGRRDGERRLFVRRLDGFDTQEIPGSEGGYWPFLSPDGTRVAFFAAGRLKVAALGGALPEPICGVPGQTYGAVWTADDRLVFVTNSISIPHWVGPEGGVPQPLEFRDLEPGTRLDYLRPLPGGNALLATGHVPSLDGPRIILLDLENSSSEVLARGFNPQFVAPDKLLFVQRDQVVAAPFDPDARRLTGPATTAALTAPAIHSGGLEATQFLTAAAADGTLLYPSGRFETEVELHWVGRDGALQPTGVFGEGPLLDRSGEHALVQRDSDVWLVRLDSGQTTRLSFNGTTGYSMWSADGQRVIFSDRRDGTFQAFSVAADGSDQASPLQRVEPSGLPTSMAPDGTMMVYRIHPETSRDILTIEPGGREVEILATEANERAGVISPDGKLFAYVSDEEGSDEVYLRQLPDTGRRWAVSSGGGASPIWNHDGTELLFIVGDTILVTRLNRDGPLHVGQPEELFKSERLNYDPWGNRSFDIASDGRLLIGLTRPHDVTTRVVVGWGHLD